MNNSKQLDYFIDTVGRPSYKPETKKLVWHVFVEEERNIVAVNLFDYNYNFAAKGLMEAKKKYSNNFSEFANYIRLWLMYEFWNRSEYEVTIASYPPHISEDELKRLGIQKTMRAANGESFCRETVELETSERVDVYTQVMLNWDRFIDYLWNNKDLITKKKLNI